MAESNSWKIYMLAVVSFLVGTSELIIAGILDLISKDVGVSVSVAGQLITVFSLAYAFGTPLLMGATSRMDRRGLMVAALGLFVVGNAVAVLAPGFMTLMVSRIILALSTGVFVVVALTVAAKMAPEGRQGNSIATVVMGFSTSLIVGVPIGRVVASAFDWRTAFGGIGILGLVAMLIIYKTIPKSEGEKAASLREQVGILKSPKVAVTLAISFFWIFGYSIAYTYISPFLLTITGMSEREVSIGLFAFGVASLIGSKLGGYGTDHWGIPRTLLGGMVLHSIALFLLTAAAPHAWLVFPILMLWSFSAWSAGPTQQLNLMTIAPNSSSIMLSLNTSVFQLAMAAGAGLGGIIVQKISLSSVSWIGATGVALAAIAVVVSFRLRAGEKTTQETGHASASMESPLIVHEEVS